MKASTMCWLVVLGLLGCGANGGQPSARPSPPASARAPSPPSASPLVQADQDNAPSGGPEVAPVAEAPPVPEHARVRRLPGMERFDSVALLEADVLCGTRRGSAPVCTTDAEWRQYAEPYEKLADVVSLHALGPTHCALFGSSRLACHTSPLAGSPAIAKPRQWQTISHHAVAVVVAGYPSVDHEVVFSLDRNGGVWGHRTVRRGSSVSYRPAERLWQGAAEIVHHGRAGVCARLRSGDVHCNDLAPPSSDMEQPASTWPQDQLGHHLPQPIIAKPPIDPTVAVATNVRGLYYKDVFIHTDGTITSSRPEAMAHRLAGLSGVSDYCPHGICALVEGHVSCAGIGGGTVAIELPAPARRFAPRGHALCAELVDGTVACWGRSRAKLEPLAARLAGSPPPEPLQMAP